MGKFHKINSLEHLKELATDNPIGVFIQLNYGLRSSKSVEYNSKDDTWEVYNYIDDTEDILKTEELEEKTNIIKAINNGALYKY